jgi:flagellar biosynthesis protein FliP
MKWQTILPWGLFVVCGIVLVVNVFWPSKTQDTFYRDKYIESLNDKLKMSEEYRKEVVEMKDAELSESRKRDSLNIMRSKANTIRYEKIPSSVRNMSSEELRRAVWEY